MSEAASPGREASVRADAVSEWIATRVQPRRLHSPAMAARRARSPAPEVALNWPGLRFISPLRVNQPNSSPRSIQPVLGFSLYREMDFRTVDSAVTFRPAHAA